MRCAVLVVTFTRRLQRRVRLRRALKDVDDLGSEQPAATSKRGRGTATPSDSSEYESDSTSDSQMLARAKPHTPRPAKRGGLGAWQPGFLLR